MNNYEKENAAEWQTVGSKQRNRPAQVKAINPNNAKGTTLPSSSSTAPIRSNQSQNNQLHPSMPPRHVLPSKPPPPAKAPRMPRRVAVPQTGPHNQQHQINVSSQRPRFTFAAGRRDNAAKTRFRNGEKPNDIFQLSKQCYKLEPNADRLYSILEEIGVRLATFVRPPQHGTDLRLLIWGEPAAIEETKQELREWHERAEQTDIGYHMKTAQDKQFSRTGINADSAIISLDKKMRQDAKRMKYQKAPPEGTKFKHNGLFLWPRDEIRPEELLGPSLEAYDGLRLASQAHILFDSSISCFKILSNEDTALELIMERIKGSMREYVARSKEQVLTYYPMFPEALQMREEVCLITPSSRASDSTADEKTLRTPVSSGMGLRASDYAEFENLKATGDKKRTKLVLKVCKTMIERLQFFRGSIRLRVDFGTFAFKQVRWDGKAISYQSFVEMLGSEKIRSSTLLKEYELDPQIGIVACKEAKHLLEPIESSRKSCDDVEPTYSARYLCDVKVLGRVHLEVASNKILGSSSYEVTRRVWQDSTDLEPPMELNFVNLTGGISSRFSVRIDNVLDSTRVTPAMADFAEGIQYHAPSSNQPGAKVLRHKGSVGVDVREIQQKTAYRFRLAGASTWVFEIARYDTFAPTASTASNTCWSGSFWNTEWDNIFNENARRTIGESASWKPTIDTFFPTLDIGPSKPEAGVSKFLDNVEKLARFLEDVKDKSRVVV